MRDGGARKVGPINRRAFDLPVSRRVYDGGVSIRPLVLIAWAAALAGFVMLSVLAAFNDTFPGDLWLAHRMQNIDFTGFGRALDSAAGSSDLPEVIPICGVAVAALFLARDMAGALILPITVAARVLITWVLKELIERPRPSAALVHFEDQPSTFSFPSGHATAAFVLYGLIFYFAALHIRDMRLRLPLQAACVAITVLTGIQRIYVGHHWPSDVLGGYYAGALIVGAVVAVHQFARRCTSSQPRDGSFTRATAAIDPK